MTDLDETPEWECAIGRLILAFGNLELVLMRLYEIKMPSRNYFDDDFNNRFDKLIGTLKSENVQAEAINALTEMKQLSETRHLLAHNPLYVDVYQHETTGHMKIEMSVTDKVHTTKKITLAQLQDEGHKASKLVELLYSAFQSELWRE